MREGVAYVVAVMRKVEQHATVKMMDVVLKFCQRACRRVEGKLSHKMSDGSGARETLSFWGMPWGVWK